MRSRKLLFLVVGLVMWSTSCDTASEQSKKAPVPRQRDPAVNTPRLLADQTAIDIVPLADGCAYANNFADGVWYVCGTHAIRVPLAEAILDIEPDAAGGAFGNSYTKGLWYLKGATAKRVADVSDAASVAPVALGDQQSRARGYWALLQTARKKLEASKEPEDVPSDDYEPEQPD